MGTQQLRAAVVGLGIGRYHVDSYAAHPNVDLVACCDLSEERRGAFTAKFPAATAYTDLQQMLDRERLDLVSICTPDWMHVDMGIAALRAGAHVITVKPLTTSIEDAQRFLEAADTAGRKLMVAHERRFHPRYLALKRVIDQGLLGQLFYVELDYFVHKGRQFASAPWYKSAEHPRAAILGTGSHAVDLMRWYGGEVEEAWGIGNHLAYKDFPDDDCMLGVFKLAGGAIGRVTMTYGSVRGAGEPDLRVTIHGTKGAIEDDKLISLDQFPGEPVEEVAGRRPWGTVPPVETPKVSHSLIVDHFVDALLAGRDPQPDGREGARTVAACLAAVEASRTGRLVQPARF
ncbi:MAG: GH109 [uncultured Chloroflexi bacterium]|uniref:GH109 n=1 Tax=uncultured Chloroflexota bacterium TaxID=166587 RepID=A0A6J4J2F9_9CHLR|nr:MAG: GH109 [uncultured Chloroflexota bacterium]